MDGDIDTQKFTLRYLFIFAREVVSWQSKLKKMCCSIHCSSRIYCYESNELLWIKNFPRELSLNKETYIIHYESQSDSDLSKNAIYHSKSAQTEIHYI